VRGCGEGAAAAVGGPRRASWRQVHPFTRGLPRGSFWGTGGKRTAAFVTATAAYHEWWGTKP